MIPTLKPYSDIVADMRSGRIYIYIYLYTYIAYLFWHSIWHYFWHVLWHSIWHVFWHTFLHMFSHSSGICTWHIFWHSFWHSILYLFGNSLWLTSGGEPSAPELAVEVRRGTLWSGACGGILLGLLWSWACWQGPAGKTLRPCSRGSFWSRGCCSGSSGERCNLDRAAEARQRKEEEGGGRKRASWRNIQQPSLDRRGTSACQRVPLL